jgi:hypothetical protein
MKKQARNHVNCNLSGSDGAPAKPTSAVLGEFVTEMFEYDGGRQVTVYVPPDPPEAIVFAGDGQGISKWGPLLVKADVPPTMIVGVHRLTDETLRLHEYSPSFEPERFAAHEKFFVEDVRRWAVFWGSANDRLEPGDSIYQGRTRPPTPPDHAANCEARSPSGERIMMPSLAVPRAWSILNENAWGHGSVCWNTVKAADV